MAAPLDPNILTKPPTPKPATRDATPIGSVIACFIPLPTCDKLISVWS